MQENKTAQLQIRVSPAQKRAIKQLAQRAGADVSSWVLDTLLPRSQQRFWALMKELNQGQRPSLALAGLADLLRSLAPAELRRATASPPPQGPSGLWLAYSAAMIEQRYGELDLAPPTWITDVPALPSPYFGSDLQTLREHLLVRSPPAFRRRNIFVAPDGGRI